LLAGVSTLPAIWYPCRHVLACLISIAQLIEWRLVRASTCQFATGHPSNNDTHSSRGRYFLTALEPGMWVPCQTKVSLVV
jgi:hypothetical protein